MILKRFHSKTPHHLNLPKNESLDSRPSDAVALAPNQGIPILVAEELFRRNLTRKEVMEYEELVRKVKF